MMNIVQRHPFLSLCFVAVLTSLVHTIDYEDQLKAERASAARYIEKPALRCRLPDPETEIRIVIDRLDHAGSITSKCFIEAIDPNETPRELMWRLLQRERITS